jgi:hypothetical protein
MATTTDDKDAKTAEDAKKKLADANGVPEDVFNALKGQADAYTPYTQDEDYVRVQEQLSAEARANQEARIKNFNDLYNKVYEDSKGAYKANEALGNAKRKEAKLHSLVGAFGSLVDMFSTGTSGTKGATVPVRDFSGKVSESLNKADASDEREKGKEKADADRYKQLLYNLENNRPRPERDIALEELNRYRRSIGEKNAAAKSTLFRDIMNNYRATQVAKINADTRMGAATISARAKNGVGGSGVKYHSMPAAGGSILVPDKWKEVAVASSIVNTILTDMPIDEKDIKAWTEMITPNYIHPYISSTTYNAVLGKMLSKYPQVRNYLLTVGAMPDPNNHSSAPPQSIAAQKKKDDKDNNDKEGGEELEDKDKMHFDL